MDNGEKYNSNDFDSFCRKVGITKELTVPYNLQHNGVSERRNRSRVETAKSMIHDLDLPKFLWIGACHTVVYILNR
jgi:transposase InsO family protein